VEILAEYFAKGMITMLTIAMPCVLTAAGIGLVVGIIQAVTQVQEQTIAAAPKILGVFLIILIGGYGFISMLTNLFYEGVSIAFNVVPKNDAYVLPSDYYRYTKPFAKEMHDGVQKKSSGLKSIMNSPGALPNSQREGGAAPRVLRAPASGKPSPDFMERQRMR